MSFVRYLYAVEDVCIAALAVLCVVLWLRFIVERPRYKQLAFAVSTWCGHVLLFTMSAWFPFFDPWVLNVWSKGVRIHGLLLLITAAILFRREG